jgi:hypothetical protein
MREENPILRKLFDEISEKVERFRSENVTLHFLIMNQAVGVMRAAEALGTPLKQSCTENAIECEVDNKEMRTQIYFFQFDTKSKPGILVCTGIRFETQEIPGSMADVNLPLLCTESAIEGGVSPETLKAFKQSVKSNIR